MSDEELLSYIKEKECYVIPKGTFIVEGIDMVKAIDKQKPIKPVHRVVGGLTEPGISCPNCGSTEIYASERVWASPAFDQIGYCCDCGQAIDWSDSND